MAGKYDNARKEIVKTYFNEAGQSIIIYRVRAKNMLEFKYSNRGFIVNVDGVDTAWSGDGDTGRHFGLSKAMQITESEDFNTVKEWVDTEYSGEQGVLMNKDGYTKFLEDNKAEVEADELETKLKKATAVVSQRAEDATEAATKKSKLEMSKVLDANAKTLESVLLANDTDPTTLKAIGDQASEKSTEVGVAIETGNAASLNNALAQLANIDVKSIGDAKSLEASLQGLNLDLYKHNTSLKNALSVANKNAAASGQAGNNTLLGEVISGAATVGGTYLATQAAAEAAAAKALIICLPEGTKIDTSEGKVKVEDIKAGDKITGYNGAETEVLQKHEYKENPEAERFLEITFEDNSTVDLCDMHRIKDIRAKDYNVGDTVEDKVIKEIKWYGGVSTSYDLLTNDKGYKVSGVSVNSMIEELMELAYLLKKAA